MSPFDRTIASKALAGVIVTRKRLDDISDSADYRVLAEALLHVYMIHGDPFGTSTRGLEIWFQYEQATTSN